MWILFALAIYSTLDLAEPSKHVVSNPEGPKKPGRCSAFLCKKDEEFLKCGCQRTCANGGRADNCAAACTKGCFCKDDLVRNNSGSCVHLKDCKKDNPGTCGLNEVYMSCGTACPATCANRGEPQKCTYQCVSGCFCREGFVKNDKGLCVKISQCPKNNCGKDEEYSTCGSYCPLTCTNKDNPPICITLCKEGCFCKEGLIRNSEGRCVHPNKCPSESPPSAIPTCEQEKVVGPCRAAINRYYFNKKTRQCELFSYGGCQGNDNNFKTLQECQNTCGGGKCPKNEVFSTCVNPCNDCEIKGKCNFLVCNKGCDCKKGFYRDVNSKCIPESKCPAKIRCAKNEVFSTCVNPCNNCEIKGKCNFLVCNKGCDCKKGFYRDVNNKCIPESKCPIKQAVGGRAGKKLQNPEEDGQTWSRKSGEGSDIQLIKGDYSANEDYYSDEDYYSFGDYSFDGDYSSDSYSSREN